MKVCVAATMKTQTGEEKSSNHRHRLDTFTQSCSFRLIPPPPPLEANTQVLHHTVCSFLSCIVQLFLLCGLQAGFFIVVIHPTRLSFVLKHQPVSDPDSKADLAWEGEKNGKEINKKTVCQFSNKVSQCAPISVMSSRARQVTLCFGNHTGRKSNKQ